jgi:hypothetical protein
LTNVVSVALNVVACGVAKRRTSTTIDDKFRSSSNQLSSQKSHRRQRQCPKTSRFNYSLLWSGLKKNSYYFSVKKPFWNLINDWSMFNFDQSACWLSVKSTRKKITKTTTFVKSYLKCFVFSYSLILFWSFINLAYHIFC